MAEKKERQPLQIKNLADLKRHIKLGTELVATAHQYHPDIVGLTRVVTKVQTNGFYSKIKDQPEHKWSTCNHGAGFWSPFEKAGAYRFNGSTVQVLNTRKNDGSVLYEMELYDGEQNMTKQNEEVPDMNESTPRLLKWGIILSGVCITADISESPSSDGACILSDILIPDVPDKYFLSAAAMRRISGNLSAAPKGNPKKRSRWSSSAGSKLLKQCDTFIPSFHTYRPALWLLS